MRLTLFLMAALLYGQSAPDPTVVLDQARAKVRATMWRIPKYACLQTIDRSYYEPPRPYFGEVSCDQISADKKNQPKPPRLASTDRLRLEVAQGAETEIHSWPGASRFDLALFDQIVDTGPFGTGTFGGYLMDIFDNPGVEFDYRGEQTREGKRLLVYGYTVAHEISHYDVKAHDSWVTSGYGGTFEVDPESLEVERLTLQTSELPVETGLCEAVSALDYQRVQIGDGTFLLPRASQLRLIFRSGRETNNATTFQGCREFHAESAVHFGAETAAVDVPDAPGKSRPPLPRGLDVDLRLIDRIDTETSAMGDPVTAAVVRDVHAGGSKEILIPAGAVVHGRINRMEHHLIPSEYLVIGLSLQSLEMGGESLPFNARLQTAANLTGRSTPGDSSRSLTERTPMGPVNSFRFPFEKHHVMAAGTLSHWVTIDPATSR
jgi:hypothetical protein